ncbi:MAG TPA: hydroxyacid dehydrogenase [Candidatus Methylacidiphilales bacterium]
MFAISEGEAENFFGGALPSSFSDAAVIRIPAGELADAGRFRTLLQRVRPDVLVSCWSTPPLPAEWIAGEGCPLRYVCHLTGSVRNVVPRRFLERGGLVTNWGGLVAFDVAEHALLLALAALRNMNAWRPYVEAAEGEAVSWIDFIRPRPLRGCRVGIHGFGRIARALVKLLKPFDVRISAFSEGVPHAMMQEAGAEPCDSLEALFGRSDILFECEALTPRTERSVDARALAALPDGAVFVNIGRGRLVEETALLREARSGRLSLALDVLSDEPLRKESPFYRLPNVVLSPHIAGPTASRLAECGAQALRNVRAFLEGRAPESVVTLSAYDMST